jgi:hypothetical protein
MVDAESFYSRMAVPEPPGDLRLEAVAKLIEAPPAPPPAPRGPDAAEAAARRFYAPQPAQDRAEPSGRENVPPNPEATSAPPDEAQREHEERRQAEADRASSLYDLPMAPDGDNPRYDEPPLTDANEFSPSIPDDLRANLQDGEQQQIVESFVASGIGLTQAQAFIRQGVAASRTGPLSDQQIQQKNAAGLAELQKRWGDQVPAKLAAAKDMIRQAETKWPGLTNYLNATGLGSDPKLIQQLVARAERRPGRK